MMVTHLTSAGQKYSRRWVIRPESESCKVSAIDPMGFAELKRDSGIESNLSPAFHVGKLEGLVQQNSEGSYELTDEGREALRIIDASKSSEKNRTSLRGQKRIVHIERRKLMDGRSLGRSSNSGFDHNRPTGRVSSSANSFPRSDNRYHRWLKILGFDGIS